MAIDWSKYKKVVILTGAGISAASGIKTFRDSDGLWENHAIEEVATPEAFQRDPFLVWKFYSMRRRNAAEAKPNAAHLALDQFAKAFKGELTLITQNVDSLHQRANHNGLLHPICMHGSLELSRCTHCQHIWLDDTVWVGDLSAYSSGILTPEQRSHPDSLSHYKVTVDLMRLPLSPCCQKLLRPHIVWFGEEPLYMDRILGEISNCDLFISIGTSGVVYPAAGFIHMAKARGADTVLFNKEKIKHYENIDLFIEGPAEITIPEYFRL
jgi:NAD-dependent deacetylase